MAREIIAARLELLQNPVYERRLAEFHKQGVPTANLARDRATFAIYDHHENGGVIQTAKGVTLDIERMETRGEEHVYDCNREKVFLKEDCPLTRTEDSFGANPRRTMNHLFEKIDRPSKQTVDTRRLPLMFWLDVAKQIMESV